MEDNYMFISIQEQQAALDQGQIVVFLQPKINMATDNLCGAEALVRWYHPEKGIILPGKFLESFEQSGLIVQLDCYVWEKVCQILSDWKAAGHLFFPISVNASVQSLHSAETLNSLLNIVTKYAVLPSFIQVEMTEMAYVENGELTQKAIQFLHDAGFSVILDNFGCGYASLNMLKELKYDAIKLDMRFMPIKDKTENDEIMLASLIKMTNWMGMSVIAEAVENRRQKDFLMAAGCDCAQGFLFGEPVAREDYEERYISTLLQSNAQLSMGEFGDDTKHNMTILIIDDEELSRDLLKSIFAGLYHIHTCSNAEDGLLYLKHNKGKVKLILVDNFMPGMGGMDFLRFCKQDPALAMIPQIMITTSDDDVDQLKAFHEGAYDYITKPYTKEVVMARVNHVMEISCRTSIFDIIEQKYRQQPELDADTALLNKMAFVDLSSRVLDIFPDERQALLVIDVDDFKQVNDKHGHLVGDKVIRCIADEMTNSFRKTDVVGRFGGDEFVVLMTKIHGLEIAKSKAVELIKAIMVSCTRKFGISISISIGLAFSEKDTDFETLFAKADQALYEAKRTGKGKAVVFGETVPPIINNDEPVVIICSDDAQVYSTIALTYASGAAFAQAWNAKDLEKLYHLYKERIRVVCLDMTKKVFESAGRTYQQIAEQSKDKQFLTLAICTEGNMVNLKKALELDVHDVLMLPPPVGVIERIVSRTIMEANAKKTVK